MAVLYDVHDSVVLDLQDAGAAGDLVDRGSRALWFHQGELGECTAKELVTTKEDEIKLPDGDRIVAPLAGVTTR